MRCSHAEAVPVESVVTGEVLAALCPACDVQLSAEFLTCPHDNVIEITNLGEVPGRGICNGCGTSAWFDKHPRDQRAGMLAQLVAAGWEPASALAAVTTGQFELLKHLAEADSSQPQAVITLDSDVTAEDLERFKARFRAAQQGPHRMLFVPYVASISAPTITELL